MAEPVPGRGRGGRGAAIARLLEMERRPGQPPAPPAGDSPPVEEQVPIPIPRPGGRGAILQRIQQMPIETIRQAPTSQASAPSVSESSSLYQQTPPPTVPQPPVSGGRGRMIQLQREMETKSAPVQVQSVPVIQPSRTQPTTVSSDTEVRKVTQRLRRMEISPDQPPVIMHGSGGTQFPATANYIRLELQPGRGVFEYEVRFTPPVDDRSACERMLFFQHSEVLGRRKTFDGVTLYVPYKIEENDTKLTSTHPVTKEPHTILLIFKRERSMGECIHLYNVLFNNIQKELQLCRIGRDYYSQRLAHNIPQYRLEVWPGFITAVEAYEDGIMLNCNVSHKVLRTQTVLEYIHEIINVSGGRDWKDILQKNLMGQSVMTRTPVNMYRIDDIDFDKNPTCEFEKPDGTKMTYIDYHLRRGIEIRDKKQPLLIHKNRRKQRPGGSELLMLIPELCFLTGLTDEMRGDFKLMKEVAAYNKVNPNERQRSIQKFLDNIKSSPNCVKLLDEWGLKVPDSTINLTGRTMTQEQVIFGRGHVDKGSEQAEWSRPATSQHMLEVVNISNWMVVHTQRDERNARDFIEMLSRVCPQMGVDVNFPDVQKIRDDKTETYLRTLRDNLTPTLQLVVVIFPSSRDDRYSAIKKLCCVDRPIPSQVINSRTISRPDKLRSIVQKIALQINCKLGGALWMVKIPFKNAMICGVDTYHDSKNRSQSVAAFVASMNTSVTRWHSQVFILSSEREMLDGLNIAMCTALQKYSQVNGKYPDTVIVFRDGVGDGQLRACKELEIPAVENAFTAVSPDCRINLAFIVCQKRINTRIFMHSHNRDFNNPPPGSVVDHTITRRYLYDFFLVSQLVRQGTVTPTHYIVVHNTTTLDPDKIQKITYKMCHLYYNWPGTIRLPAPCQYAHKLAYLVGMSIHREPAKVLCDKLFFL